MEFELITTTSVFSKISRKTFVEMLIKAIEITESCDTWYSMDGYTCKYKKYWRFNDLDIDLVVYADTYKEINDLMEEIKKDERYINAIKKL